MKKKIIISTIVLSMISVASVPIIFTSCSKTVNNNEISTEEQKYSSIWNLDNKKVIYLKDSNIGSDLDEIQILDNSNNQIIEFDRINSKISDNQLFINFNNVFDLPSSFKVVNTKNNYYTVINNDEAKKTFQEYNLIHDQKYFFDLIKDMSQNKIPSIGMMRDATLIVQEAFIISLLNYFNNPNSTDDQTFLFGKKIIWNETRFNQQTLIDAGIWNGNKDFGSNEYKKFNLYQNEVIANYQNEIIEIFGKILRDTKNEYFDLFQDENDFMIQLINFNEDYFNFLFKHANRILIMSDGAYHVDKTIPQLVSLLNNHIPRPRDEVIKILNDFRNGNISKITQRDVLDFMLLKNYEFANDNQESKFDFVSFINYDGNIFNSIELNDNKRFHDSAFSTNFIDYVNYIDGEQNKTSFLDVFSKLFISNNLSKEDIFINGASEYDPNKKNAIFIGSSLFRPLGNDKVSETNFSRLDIMPNVLNEIQNTFKDFLNKFNPDKYNIIFKLHPVFSNVDDPKNLGAINYIKQISNNAIKQPIIVNSKIPLETWIAVDYSKYKKNPNNTDESIIFRKTKDSNDINSAKEWTTFFGLQATSTTIHTTRLFYQSAFGIDKNQVAELIPFSNFPIPKLFPVVERLEVDSTYNYTEDNIKRINSIFKAYCPSIQYSLADNIDNLSMFDSIVLNF